MLLKYTVDSENMTSSGSCLYDKIAKIKFRAEEQGIDEAPLRCAKNRRNALQRAHSASKRAEEQSYSIANND